MWSQAGGLYHCLRRSRCHCLCSGGDLSDSAAPAAGSVNWWLRPLAGVDMQRSCYPRGILIQPLIVEWLTYQAGAYRILSNVRPFPAEFFIVSHDAVVSLVLPDSSLPLQESIDFVSGVPLIRVQYLSKREPRAGRLGEWSRQCADVVRHYDRCMEQVAPTVPMSPVLQHGIPTNRAKCYSCSAAVCQKVG